MKYELYDILPIDDKDYIITSKIIDGNFEYFLLLEIDEKENPIANSIKILAHSLIDDYASNKLLQIEDQEELKRVKYLLDVALIDDLKEVE